MVMMSSVAANHHYEWAFAFLMRSILWEELLPDRAITLPLWTHI